MINKYCIANWKMNFTTKESLDFVSKLNAKDLNKGESQIILCPSFTAIHSTVSASLESSILVGAQDMNSNKSGAHTGEISADMLKETGAEYVILGHSERRHIYGEKDKVINDKIVQALANNLVPILCIGEHLDERESGNTNLILKEQLKVGLNNIKGEFIIAYEPVWAIGTGKSATPTMVAETHLSIRNMLLDLNFPKNISLLYGGSVTPENASDLSSVPNVDGFLIGGASLDVEKFYKIYLDL